MPTPPLPPGGGDGGDTEVEGEILAIGENYLDLADVRLYFDEATEIKFNDVDGFAVGLPVQYKGMQDAEGVITATLLEVN